MSHEARTSKGRHAISPEQLKMKGILDDGVHDRLLPAATSEHDLDDGDVNVRRPRKRRQHDELLLQACRRPHGCRRTSDIIPGLQQHIRQGLPTTALRSRSLLFEDLVFGAPLVEDLVFGVSQPGVNLEIVGGKVPSECHTEAEEVVMREARAPQHRLVDEARRRHDRRILHHVARL